jgi:predicted ester cyclase
MSLEENKVLIRQWYEAFEGYFQGDVSALDGRIAFDVVNHNAVPDTTYSLKGFKLSIDHFRTAFSNVRFAINDLIAEGDKVVVHTTVSLTHTGEFLGKPSTGKHVSMTWIDIFRIADDLIVERWGLEDDLSLLQQIDSDSSLGASE